MQSDFLKDKQILIIEDSRISQSVLEKIVSQAGGTVYIYDSLEEVEKIFENYYDIAIMDLLLQESSTLDIIPTLKEQNPNLRIIVQTALPNLLNQRPDIQEMIDFVIAKPATSEKIRQILEKCVYRPLKGKHILIVEDARVSREAITRLIHRLGGTPYAYANLDDLENLLAHKYDVAILDLLIGSETSIPLIPKLRQKNPEIYIFIISAMPNILHKHPEVMPELAYIFQKPITDKQLERNLVVTLKQPYSERRKTLRKQGLSHCWVARFDRELNQAELFESPYLADVSNHGMCFHSFLNYEVGDEIITWFLVPNTAQKQKILELRGTIRWQKALNKGGSENKTSFGVEFDAAKSPSFADWQVAVTRIIEK